MGLIFYCSMTASAAGDEKCTSCGLGIVTIYKNWSVGLYEAYEDN